MFDFAEYRAKAYEYSKNKCVIDNNIKILNEQGISVKHWGENSGKIKFIKDMNTSEMKEVEKEFNVSFSLGGTGFVKFEFNEEINGDYNPLMKEIRVAQKNNSDLYNGYFKEALNSVYQSTTICGKHHRIELGTKFWGFLIKGIEKLTLDEIIEIEKETDSVFKNYDVTHGYHFNFNF